MLLPCQERLVRVCRRSEQIRCLCHRVPRLQTSYFPLSNRVISKETEKSQMQQLPLSGLQKFFFQVHNKNMFESCLDLLSPELSQSADRKPKGGYQAAKLAGPDITFQFQPEILSKNPCNAIVKQASTSILRLYQGEGVGGHDSNGVLKP